MQALSGLSQTSRRRFSSPRAFRLTRRAYCSSISKAERDYPAHIPSSKASISNATAPAKVYLEHPRRIQRDLHATIDWDKWIGIFETRKVTKQGIVSVGGVAYTLKDGFAGREVEILRLPGKINVFSNGELVDTIPTPEAPGMSQPAETRRINKDGYLKFHKRMYKLGARYAHKAVRALATDDGRAVLVYDGDVLIARLDVNDGKPYKN